MATLIKSTPTLYGKDADNFLKQIKCSEKVSVEDLKNNLNQLKEIFGGLKT